jgi:hypothetical protein
MVELDGFSGHNSVLCIVVQWLLDLTNKQTTVTMMAWDGERLDRQ